MIEVYIYALIDPRTDEIRYIGKANDPYERYKNHYNSARDKNTHKRNWINNVRKDGFRPELLILDKVSVEEWQFWEKFYISLYKSYGFNLVNYTNGGDGSTFGNRGSFKKGNIPHNKGISPSEETKQKIRDNYVPNNSCQIKIIQYDFNYNIINKFNSLTEASNTGFSISKISDCCKLKRKQHKNYIWKYDDGKEIIKESIKLLKKKVIQYDKKMNEINRYNSIKEAANKLNIFESGICNCCKNKLKTSGGFIWKYV